MLVEFCFVLEHEGLYDFGQEKLRSVLTKKMVMIISIRLVDVSIFSVTFVSVEIFFHIGSLELLGHFLCGYGGIYQKVF